MASRRAPSRAGNQVHKDDENAPAANTKPPVSGIVQPKFGVASGLLKAKSSGSLRTDANATTGTAAAANPRKRILNDRTNTAATGVEAAMKRPTLTRKPSNLTTRAATANGARKEDVESMAVDDGKRPIKGIRKGASSASLVAGSSKLAGGDVAGTSKAGSTSTSEGGPRRGLSVKQGANNGATAIPRPGAASSRLGAGAKKAAPAGKRLAVFAKKDDEEEEEAIKEPEAKRLRTSEPDAAPGEADEDEDAEQEEDEEDYAAAVTKDEGRALKEGEEGWEDLDAGDEDDPLMVSEYVHEVYDYMRELELRTLPDADYMSRQDELTWKMRGILVDWLVEVHTKFRLLPETIFLMSNLIDRFLSLRVVSLVKFQLVGITALFVAAKYEEVVCPSVTNFVYMTEDGYEAEEMLSAERYLLRMVDFNLSYPNPLNFLRRISKADKYDIQSRTFAKYFMEIAIVEHRLLPFPPSLVAAAATWLARKILKRGAWDANLVHYSGYSQREVLAPAQVMLDYCLRTAAAEDPEHVNFHKKYSSKKFYRCSEIVREWVAGRYMEKTATGHDFFRLEEWEE